MHLIVGLGNPGSEYIQTRHNTGFLVVDELAVSANVTFRPGKGEYWLAECSLNNFDVTMLKPTTHMNNSGITVREFREKNEIPLENILVVCDDFQLPLGTIRFRQNGTDGGHNGLSSVIYHLQTDQFARLRCGIASSFMTSKKPNMRDFVLEKFDESEIPLLKAMIERARDGCISYIVDGINRAMNRFNTISQNNIT
jgi:PTH1 family peptidyl-tRNA hydrolase